MWGTEWLRNFPEQEKLIDQWAGMPRKNSILVMVTAWESMNKYYKPILLFQPENIMCETKNSSKVKLIDFGLAAKLDPEQPVKVSVATAEFAAPEIADHDAIGFYTDMWSIGVLSYVM